VPAVKCVEGEECSDEGYVTYVTMCPEVAVLPSLWLGEEVGRGQFRAPIFSVTERPFGNTRI